MKKSSLVILALITFLGLGLRLYHLDSRPLGFTWDEAALGYNAYSLIKTGKDEYGKILPIVFKSFGDYKPGLYVYFSVPIIKIFGLNEFATRLPSAVFGVLTIVVLYLLTRNLAAGFLFAINPWSIHFSRGAWEANVFVFLLVLGTHTFLKKRYLLTAVLFGLTFWTYQGAKMFTPLLTLLLLFIYRQELNIKKLVAPTILGFAILLPILWGFTTQSGRLKVFSVFSYTRADEVVSNILKADGGRDLFGFHAEIVDQVRGIAQRFLNHLSPKYLFFTGDWSNLRQSTPYYGYFHLPEIITILVGLMVLLRTKNKQTKLLLGWLFLAIIPSALSRDIISGVRSLPMVIPLTILSGIGLSKLKWVLLPVILFFVIYFSDLYFVHSPFFVAKDWLSGYKPALMAAKQFIDKYDRVVITDVFGQPYIFVLFYYQVDPSKYQVSAKLLENANGDVGEIKTFDKYQFRRIYWPTERGARSTIFIGNESDLPARDMNPENLIKIKDVYYPDKTHALRVVALQ